LLYKKTDSTLRGNIASELRALRDAFPGRPLVYVPAYPQLGRTVRGGRLYVDGVPLDRSDFARDPLNPATESDIGKVIQGLQARICDGETVAEIEAEAERIATADPLPVAAGPAALAEALAARLQLPRGNSALWPRIGRCLAVNGSLHPMARAQVEHARANGWRIARPECAPGALAKGGWYLLDTADTGGEGVERAARVGYLVTSIMNAAPLDALVVFGGDTAFGMHSALDPCDFVPLGEIVPGVPVCKRGECFWITKAGGFGGPEILCEIRKRLQ
jgi:uncharacterized protein YgbK (DUF1537 family)